MNSMQLKDKLRNISKDKNVDINTLLRIYMYDRFIERLSNSKYSNNFVIKGGFYLSTLYGVESRSTMDIDTMFRNANFDEKTLINMFNDIIKIDLEDNVTFEIIDVDTIRDEDEDGGFRFNFVASMENIKEKFHIDVATGDPITPKAIIFKYIPLLGDRYINVYAYNIETVLAEKLEMANKCIFYHETFLRNTYDILTYQESGIKKIICSKDMHLKDIKLLPKENKDSYGIICFGYIPLYESQRKILTHYISMNKLPKSLLYSNTLSLKEHTRDDRYKVIEQEGVSSIFDSKVYSYLPYIKELSENINMFIVDSLFFETSYIKEVVELIKKAHQGIDVTEELTKLDESISFTDGFLNKKIGLM